MVGTRLLVHIRPDAPPARILELLEYLSLERETRYASVAELNAHLVGLGFGKASEMESVASMAHMLGLLAREARGVGLSDDGAWLARAKESTRADLLHFRFYTRWTAAQPTEAVKSWSYRNCLDAYWEAQNMALTPAYLDQRAQGTINDAERTFGALGVYDLAEISFSRKSLAAIHLWLAALRPPVLADSHFARRAFCPPELLLLALGWALGDEADGGGDVLLSRGKREAICRVCLLEPTALDGALDWMLPAFPDVIAPGTSAGFYGRFVRLLRRPTLADVVR
jgi:hypothetical protein